MANDQPQQAQQEPLARSQQALHRELLTIVDHAYFQPPENVKLQYPCIIYSCNNVLPQFANNKPYINYDRYELILIYKDPNTELVKNLRNKFKYCRLDRHYVSDNLYHDAFNLYY